MNKKSLLFLIAISLVVSPIFALAQTESSNKQNSVQNIKAQMEAKTESIKQEMASRTDAIKNSIEARKQNAVGQMKDRVDQFISNTIKRFNAAANRLDILAGRIDSRIAKIEARGINESKAKALLVTAKTKIATAKADIAAITVQTADTAGADKISSTTANALRESFGVTKTQIEKAKKDLKDAQAALVDVINSLKPGDKKLSDLESKSATSTATTTKSD
jgi:hypothetical protein